MQNSFQNNVPTQANTPKSLTFDQYLMNNQCLPLRNFPNAQSNSNLGNSGQSIFNQAKPNSSDLESLLEMLKQQQAKDKMETEQQSVGLEDASTKQFGDFECKKEVTSKGDAMEETNDIQKEGIIRPEAIKDNLFPLGFSQMNSLQQHLENNLNSLKLQKAASEDTSFKSTIETAAMDTIKTALSAQLLLGEALKKAAILNNLMNLQVNCGK